MGLFNQAVAHRGGDRGQLGVDPEFVENVLDVVPHRVEAEMELRGERLVGQAAGHQPHHLEFSDA
jgi:hypothetical protein